MKGKPRSVRQAQALQSAQLRSQGRSWADIGAYFQAAYRVNPRVAIRQAHGWSQPQAAERWTALWPDDPKTFKNFSYWEQWPGQTGHAPSLDTLDRLAQLYECKVTDLLADCHDYGARSAPRTASIHARDRAQDPGRIRERLQWQQPDRSWAAQTAQEPDASAAQLSSRSALESALELIRQAQATDSDHLGEADLPDHRLRRRTLLLEASSALAVVAATPMLEVPRIVAATKSGRASANVEIVRYTGDVVAGLRWLGGAVGPRITLQPAMALRAAMASLARSMPDLVTPQALTSYGDLTQLIGWLMFNLNDHKAARYYYDDARAAAYRAGNHDLVAFTLSAASQLAVNRQRPRHAIDHAQAALEEAKLSGSLHAMAYASDVTARAYAAADQAGRCRAALDKEREALALIATDTPRSPWWYFYDSSFYWGTESECALRLRMPVEAWYAADCALDLVAPTNLHNNALTLAFSAEALIERGEIEQACQALADSARLTTLNSSERITRRIRDLRRQLRTVHDIPAVRELDEKLAEYRRARAAGEAADDDMATLGVD
ncbi:MAG TPA: hypothetical protein VF834_14265 [Streptosporangiaceae bacterium]